MIKHKFDGSSRASAASATERSVYSATKLTHSGLRPREQPEGRGGQKVWIETAECVLFWFFVVSCWFTGWALPQKTTETGTFYNWVSLCLAVIVSIRPQGKCPAPLWIQRDYMDRLDLFIITNRTREVSSRRSEASSVNQCCSQSWTSTVTSMTEGQELPKVLHCAWHDTESDRLI